MRRTLVAAALLLAFALASSARAEDVDFDRPEAWAMKYFAGVTLLTPLTAGRPAAGDVDIGFELGLIPHLDAEQRLIGFNGTKEEDLNKLPVIGRARARFGLPAGFLLDLAYLPPLEVQGVKGHVLSVGVERELGRSGSWSWSLRGHGQVGQVNGDYTCSEEVAAVPPGEPGNLYGCEGPSDDTSTLNYLGLAAVAAYRPSSGRAPVVQAALLATYNDLKFEVDAVTYGYHDQNVLTTDGMTYAVTVGVDWALGAATGLALEALYVPLTVLRPPYEQREHDDLLTVRAAFVYRLD